MQMKLFLAELPQCAAKETVGPLISMQPDIASPICSGTAEGRIVGGRGGLEQSAPLLLLLLLVGLKVLVDDGDCQQDTWQRQSSQQIGSSMVIASPTCFRCCPFSGGTNGTLSRIAPVPELMAPIKSVLMVSNSEHIGSMPVDETHMSPRSPLW